MQARAGEAKSKTFHLAFAFVGEDFLLEDTNC